MFELVSSLWPEAYLHIQSGRREAEGENGHIFRGASSRVYLSPVRESSQTNLAPGTFRSFRVVAFYPICDHHKIIGIGS